MEVSNLRFHWQTVLYQNIIHDFHCIIHFQQRMCLQRYIYILKIHKIIINGSQFFYLKSSIRKQLLSSRARATIILIPSKRNGNAL